METEQAGGAVVSPVDPALLVGVLLTEAEVFRVQADMARLTSFDRESAPPRDDLSPLGR